MSITMYIITFKPYMILFSQTHRSKDVVDQVPSLEVDIYINITK